MRSQNTLHFGAKDPRSRRTALFGRERSTSRFYNFNRPRKWLTCVLNTRVQSGRSLYGDACAAVRCNGVLAHRNIVPTRRKIIGTRNQMMTGGLDQTVRRISEDERPFDRPSPATSAFRDGPIVLSRDHCIINISCWRARLCNTVKLESMWHRSTGKRNKTSRAVEPNENEKNK